MISPISLAHSLTSLIYTLAKCKWSMFFHVIFFVCFITIFLGCLWFACQVFNLISVQVWSFEISDLMSSWCDSKDVKFEIQRTEMETELAGHVYFQSQQTLTVESHKWNLLYTWPFCS
jgi:hypothetical protein